MAHQLNGLFPQSLLKAFSVLIFIILLKDVCNGQPQLIGPSQALVARAGDDVILPCHVEPAYDVSTMTLEWTRSSLDPRFVFVSRGSQELENLKNPSFKGRTSVFVDELKNGNISLKISKVKSDDTGIYRCYVPVLEKEAFVELVVGQPQLIGPSQALVARAGDDVILPCHVEPAYDVSAKTLEWTRSSLDPRFVFVSRGSQELEKLKNPSFKGRTSVFVDELKNGNISLKISRVKSDDTGIYRCYVPVLEKEAFVELVVASDAATSPVISLSGTDKNRGGVVLQCESAGWYPEPELLWLDGEGNLLSAGPTETLRGPDDLYTVSSRVTVEKRHSNNITCRVQQKEISQSRETHIHVQEDFFEILSSSSSLIIGLAVSLALCIILLILSAVVLLRRNKKHLMKTNRSPKDQTDSGDAKGSSEEARETERLNTSSSSTKTKKQTSCLPITSRRKLEEEQQRREEAEKNLQDIKAKMIKSEMEKAEFIQKLMETFLTLESKSEKETEINNQLQQVNKVVERLKNQLENKDQEIIDSEEEKNEIIQTLMQTFPSTLESKLSGNISQAQEEKQKMEREMERLRNELESTKQQLQQQKKAAENLKKLLGEKNRESKKKTEIIDQLQEEKKTLEDLKNQFKSKCHEMIKSEIEKNEFIQKLMETFPTLESKIIDSEKQKNGITKKVMETFPTLDSKLSELIDQQTELQWKKNTEIINQLQEVKETVKELEKKNQELQCKKDDEIIKDLQNLKKQTESKNQEMLRAEKRRNEETDRKVKELIRQLEKEKTKTEEKLNELVKQLKEEKTEMNKLQKGDIILDEVDGLAPYICLKNTSSEDKMMTGWEIKLQINNRNPDTYKFERNFTLKARKGLTLHRFSLTRSPYPDNTHLRWADMSRWNSRDNVKINFMSNTGEEHRLM